MQLSLTPRIGPRCCACVRVVPLCVCCAFGSARARVRLCALSHLRRPGKEWMESVCVYVARCMMCVACCVLKVGCGPILRVAF